MGRSQQVGPCNGWWMSLRTYLMIYLRLTLRSGGVACPHFSTCQVPQAHLSVLKKTGRSCNLRQVLILACSDSVG